MQPFEKTSKILSRRQLEKQGKDLKEQERGKIVADVGEIEKIMNNILTIKLKI